MPEFQYLQPATVGDASAMLASHGDDGCIVAGGTGILRSLHDRAALPTTLISLTAIEDIKGISYRDDKGLRMGALVTHGEVAGHPDIQSNYPTFAAVEDGHADGQVRGQGTLGGAVCAGAVETDVSSTLLALGARAMLGSAKGERYLTIDEFLVEGGKTALAPDEVLMRIYIPVQKLNVAKSARFAGASDQHAVVDFSVAAHQVKGGCEDPRIVVGVSPVGPQRIARAEAFLAGKAITRAVIAQAVELIVQDATAIAGAVEDAEYRSTLVAKLQSTLADAFAVAG